MTRSIFLIVGIMMILAASVHAQDPDDPGAPDSLIFGDVEIQYNPGQDNYVNVPVYFVTDDSIASVMIPIEWTSSDGSMSLVSVTYEEPFDLWDDFYVNDDNDWVVGFCDMGGEENESFMFTDGERMAYLMLEFRIAAGAEEQFIPITVGEGPNGMPVNFGLYTPGSDEDITPVVVDGFIRFGTVDVDDAVAELPTEYAVKQNYPNPFNPETNIEYHLPQAGYVDISIYNILGQNVRTLVSGEQPAGIHKAHWDGYGNDGEAVPSGIYFYSINAGSYNETKKMVMIK